MGSVINLTHHDDHTTVRIGCINNLRRSVQILDTKYFRTAECKSMLLQPQNGAEAQFNSLKVKIYENRHWYICSGASGICVHKLLSRYAGALCRCGAPMTRGVILDENVSKDKADVEDRGVFARESTRYLISDDLHVFPLLTTPTFSLLCRFGAASAGVTEERTFSVGVKEMVNLLKCSLESDAPLTETLLELEIEPKLIKEDSFHGTRHESEGGKSVKGTVYIRLIASKSRKVVCYADASEGFVDLLFSFLTVPLGYIFKEMRGASPKGCAFHLYKSVEDLDAAKYLKSDEHKNMLLCPKVAPFHGFEKQLLTVEEVLNKKYYCCVDSLIDAQLTTISRTLDSKTGITISKLGSRVISKSELKMMDPNKATEKRRLKNIFLCVILIGKS